MGVWCGDAWSWKIIRGEEVLGLEATREYEELNVVLQGIYENLKQGKGVIVMDVRRK